MFRARTRLDPSGLRRGFGLFTGRRGPAGERDDVIVAPVRGRVSGLPLEAPSGKVGLVVGHRFDVVPGVGGVGRQADVGDANPAGRRAWLAGEVTVSERSENPVPVTLHPVSVVAVTVNVFAPGVVATVSADAPVPSPCSVTDRPEAASQPLLLGSRRQTRQ